MNSGEENSLTAPAGIQTLNLSIMSLMLLPTSYSCSPGCVTLTIFHGDNNIKSIASQVLKQIINIYIYMYHYFPLLHIYSREIIDVFSSLTPPKVIIGFLANTVLGRSFTLCMVMTLLGVWQFIPNLINKVTGKSDS